MSNNQKQSCDTPSNEKLSTPVYKTLNGVESWDNASKDARIAFYGAMKGHAYGHEPTRSAWDWFLAGWSNRPGHETTAPHCLNCQCAQAEKGMVDRSDHLDFHRALMTIKYESVSLADAQVTAGEALQHKRSSVEPVPAETTSRIGLYGDISGNPYGPSEPPDDVEPDQPMLQGPGGKLIGHLPDQLLDVHAVKGERCGMPHELYWRTCDLPKGHKDNHRSETEGSVCWWASNLTAEQQRDILAKRAQVKASGNVPRGPSPVEPTPRMDGYTCRKCGVWYAGPNGFHECSAS